MADAASDSKTAADLVAGLANLRTPAGISGYCDVSALRATATDWATDADLFDRAGSDEAIAARCLGMPLAQAAEASVLGRLASFDPPSVHGAFYLLPVLVAWAALGFIERQYTHAFHGDAGRPAFFAWWSDRPFAPWVFSVCLAVAIVVVIALEIRVRGKARSVRRFRIRVDSLCQELATRVARVLASTQIPASSPDRILSLASTRLESASTALTRITEMLDQGGSAEGPAVTSAAELSRTLTGLDKTMADLTTATNGLLTSVTALPDKINAWDEDLESLTDLKALVTTQGQDGARASKKFVEGVDKLVATLPQVNETIRSTVTLGQQLASGQAEVRSLLEAVQAEGAAGAERQDVQSVAIRARINDLESVVKKMEDAATELRRAGETLLQGIAVVDGLEKLRITR